MLRYHPDTDAVLRLRSGLIEAEIYLYKNPPSFVEHPQKFSLGGFDAVGFVEF